MSDPLPGKDVPITTPQPLFVQQGYYDFFKSLDTLLKNTASGLAGLPALLALKSNITRTINQQFGTTYTFLLTDADSLCMFNNVAAITVTVPPNSSVAFPVGTQIDVTQLNAGKVTFAQGAGVTIVSVAGNKALSAQYAGGTLVQIGADIWLLIGSLIP